MAFVALALAFYRQAWAAAVATIIYAACFGAYARTSGNYLREDFALPGILPATAGVVYLLTGASGKRRWLAFAATTIAALWAGSCWHMTQFSLGVLALLVLVFAVMKHSRSGAYAGAALWLGLIAAAAVNVPLREKGAMFSVTSVVALAPAAGYLLARRSRCERHARWFVLASVAVMAGGVLMRGHSSEYGHVFALAAAKVAHLGISPNPLAIELRCPPLLGGALRVTGQVQLRAGIWLVWAGRGFRADPPGP